MLQRTWTLQVKDQDEYRKRCLGPICGKYLTQELKLVGHQELDTAEKRYECIECGMCFVEGLSFLNHQKVCKGEKPYKCVECRKSFPSQSL